MKIRKLLEILEPYTDSDIEVEICEWDQDNQRDDYAAVVSVMIVVGEDTVTRIAFVSGGLSN